MVKLLDAGQLKHKYAVRLQTVLLRARDKGSADIADFLGMNPATVPQHIRRYNGGGLGALLRDKTRKPGKKPIGREVPSLRDWIVCEPWYRRLKPTVNNVLSLRDLIVCEPRYRRLKPTVNNVLSLRDLIVSPPGGPPLAPNPCVISK